MTQIKEKYKIDKQTLSGIQFQKIQIKISLQNKN